MTKQYKATPEQWALTEETSGACLSACILELRARVEALEAFMTHARPCILGLAGIVAKTGNTMDALEATQIMLTMQQPPHQDKLDRLIALDRDDELEATQPASPSAERMLALQDQIRDGALTLADAVKEIGAAPIRSSPESPLVERGADAIAAHATSAGIVNDRPARAAILEVAAWIRSELNGRNVADRLEQEANQ